MLTDDAVLAQYAHLVYQYGGRINEEGGYWPTYPVIEPGVAVHFKTHNGQAPIQVSTPLEECRRVIRELYPEEG